MNKQREGHSSGEGTATTIEKVQKGDYFRFPNTTRVYVRDDYSRTCQKYGYYRFDDVNHTGYKKKGTIVEIDFDF